MKENKFKKTEIGEIPEDWEVNKIGNLCEVKSGKRLPKGHMLTEEKTAHQYIRVRDLENGSVKVNELLFLKDETYKKISRYIIQKDDVYISIVGTIGLVGTIPEEIDGANLTENCARLTKLKNTNKEWLSYYLNSREGQAQISALTVGTTQGKLALFRIKDIIIPVPEISEQQSIAKILSDLDTQIEVLQQQNETLEVIDKALFKHWFMDFEFPNEKGKPYKSSGGAMVDSELGEIPKGWEVKPLGDFIDLDKGVSYKGAFLTEKGNGLPMANLGTFKPLRGFKDDSLKYYSGEHRERHTVKPGDLIIANTDITQHRVILGSPAIIPKYLESDKILFTHHIFAVRHKEDTLKNEYLYFLLQTPEYRMRARGFATGTTVLALPHDAILELPFIVAEKRLLNQFNELEPIHIGNKF